MTTIYTYARLESLFLGLVELRLRFAEEYFHYGRLLVTRGPGESLSEMETRNLEPGIPEMYKRLLREDSALASNLYAWVTLDMAQLPENSAETSFQQFMDAIHIVSESTPGNPSYRINSRSILVNKDTVQEVLETLSPDVKWDLSDTILYQETGWTRNISARWRYREEVLPENVDRLADWLPGINWSYAYVGNVYSVREGDRIAPLSLGVNDEGELVAPDFGGSIILLNSEDVAWTNNLQENLASARQAYRESVLSRLRTWRSNDRAERERQRSQQEARRASLQRFIDFRNKNGGKMDNTAWITTLPFVEAGKGIKSSRRWGIEIETGAGRDLRGTPDEWDAKGDGSLESAYGPTYIDPDECEYAYRHQPEVDAVWTDADGNEHDATIENPEYLDPYDCYDCGEIERDYYDDDDCVELVSPILNSMHSRGLRQICEDLEFAPRTDSAGIHVHVEAKDLTVRQIKELVMGYDHIEWLLEASYDRVERGYCKRRSPDELLEIVRQSDNQTPIDMRKGDRYVTVNLQALYSHGTIEFRAMGPKYNYEHLIRWAMFCREMVNVVAAGAKSGEFAKVKSWNDVETIFAKYGTEYNFATVGHMEEGVEFEDIEVTV